MAPENEESTENQQPQITAEEYLALQKKSIRNKSWWAIGIGGTVVALHLVFYFIVLTLGESAREQLDIDISIKMLFKSIFFILGLLGLAAGFYGLSYARNLKLEDIIPSREAVEFLRAAQGVKPYYSYFLLLCIIVVYFTQYATGFGASIEKGGLEKVGFFRDHEYWRILTSATLHGGLLHIYFNGQALYGIGSLIEYISNRAHLAIAFILSIIGGGLASVFFSPYGNSVGASGGILGLIGYLAVYGYRRKQHLPPDFLRTILVNVAFVAGIGIVGYQLIDNFAHAGGLLTGALYGFLLVPRDPTKNPREASFVTTVAGMISLVAFGAGTLLVILKLTNR